MARPVMIVHADQRADRHQPVGDPIHAEDHHADGDQVLRQQRDVDAEPGEQAGAHAGCGGGADELLPIALHAPLGADALDRLEPADALDQDAVLLRGFLERAPHDAVERHLEQQPERRSPAAPRSPGPAATGPPIHHTMAMNSNTKGRSTRVTTVAEVKKSRRLSNSRRLLANAPAEAGRAAMRMPITCSKIRLASLRSAIRPALSTK